MNKRPVSYLQTDARWKNKDYSAPSGESKKRTIGSSGCGPTCAAMLIETITGKTFTPADACAWSLKHGYKAPNQGTYYSYFAPQFKAHGIACEQLNWKNVYGKPSDPVHAKAFDLLKKGYYLIAVMGKGLWTTSGHFVVVWWEDGKVRINDPNSTAANRTSGSLSTFKSQVKYYWAIDARKHNENGKAAAEAAPAQKPAASTVKIDDAMSGPKTAYAKTWTVTADLLNMRAGAGTKRKNGQDTPIVAQLKKGTKFRCYGYYTDNGGTIWLLGVADGKKGFCSKKYLK